MIDYLIEMAENSVPINIGSLMNSLEIVNETHNYCNYTSFEYGINGAWFEAKINNERVRIYFILYGGINPMEGMKYLKQDDVVIVKLYNKTTNDLLFKNKKYCW